MSDPYSVATFEDFWPHYVRLHTRPATQWLHAAATSAWVVCALAAFAAGDARWIVLAPAFDYAIAQTSHRIFEKNRTLPWQNAAWHTRAELRMLRFVVSGRMAAEVRRHVPPAG